MPDLTRQAIFARPATKLRAEFAELSNVPHNAVRGGEAEKLVKDFLSRHLPKRFDVGSGFIIDRADRLPKQTDVVVYDAFNCPLYRASEGAAIFPSDNVAAVVEVKSRLTKDKVQEAAENIAAVKRLGKTRKPGGEGPLQVQTLGCLFAFDSELRPRKLTEHLANSVRLQGIGHHIDVAVVLDVGLLIMMAKPRGGEWTTAFIEEVGGQRAEGAHFGVGCILAGPDSLGGFLRFLLAQLMLFRPIVPHPGFIWEKTPAQGQALIEYVSNTSARILGNGIRVGRRRSLRAIGKRWSASLVKDLSRRDLPIEPRRPRRGVRGAFKGRAGRPATRTTLTRAAGPTQGNRTGTVRDRWKRQRRGSTVSGRQM